MDFVKLSNKTNKQKSYQIKNHPDHLIFIFAKLNLGMIDSHCHLEQKDYKKDLGKVLDICRKQLKAVVTCSARPKDLEEAIGLVKENSGFVFAAAGLHPEFIKEIKEKEKDDFLEAVKQNKKHIVGFGEVGLDYKWVQEAHWQEKQKEQFKEMIGFSKEIKKPLVVHSRGACADAVKILEDQDAKQVLLHMFAESKLMPSVVENNWLVSINLLVTRSKDYKKVAKEAPLENICLETDAPWNGVQKPLAEVAPTDIVFKENKEQGFATLRNDPTTIKITAEKIAEIKGLPFEKVWSVCGDNAKRFYGLDV